MEAPNKVFVNQGPRQSLIVSAGRGLKSDKEYINKDLLLDFLKEKMEETNTSSEDAVYGAWELPSNKYMTKSILYNYDTE